MEWGKIRDISHDSIMWQDTRIVCGAALEKFCCLIPTLINHSICRIYQERRAQSPELTLQKFQKFNEFEPSNRFLSVFSETNRFSADFRLQKLFFAQR
jgi:hypothetical protein